MSSSTFFEYALRIVACLCVAAAARAETGVTDTTIMIGQAAFFSGPVADTGNHDRSGIELYFNQVNRSGGSTAANFDLPRWTMPMTRNVPRRTRMP